MNETSIKDSDNMSITLDLTEFEEEELVLRSKNLSIIEQSPLKKTLNEIKNIKTMEIPTILIGNHIIHQE